MLQGHFSWQAGMSLCVAGATFGDVGVSLFAAGRVFGEIWLAGARNVVIFNTKCVSEARKVSSANGRVHAGFDHGPIMLESAPQCI